MRPIKGTNQSNIGRRIDIPLRSALQSWQASAGPLYSRLARSLGAAIEDGELPPGRRLPPERVLASHLGIGRRTVAAAYEVLRKHGLVERRQGSGTTIIGVDAPLRGDRSSKLTTSLQRNVVFQSFDGEPGSTIELLSAYAPTSGDVMTRIFKQAAADLTRFSVDHHGYSPSGFEPLRRAIADRFTEQGVPTSEYEILITNGAQQAISLIASAFVKPSQVAVLEDPTVPGAIDAFRTAGAELIPLPVHQAGADVTMLEPILARNSVGAVYLTPTYQCPTGGVMPEDARRHVVGLATRTGVPVVEDDTLRDLGLSDEPPPPLATWAEGAPVLSIGSLSKLFWAGLRVGWIRGPRAIVAHLTRLKAVADLGTSTLTQAVAVSLLGEINTMKHARRQEISEKLALVESLLRTEFDGWTWRSPRGGLCLWAKLPAGSALELTQVAMQAGVAITPGTVTSPTSRFDDHVRVPFGYQPETLKEGLARLARAWSAYSDALDHAREVRILV